MDGLIIKKKWLDKILDNGKVWEVRGSRTKKRGKIALIQSRTNLIMGTATLDNCWPFYEYPPYYKDNFKFHQIPKEILEKMTYKLKWTWELKNVVKFKTPIKYKKKQGPVIWVKDVL